MFSSFMGIKKEIAELKENNALLKDMYESCNDELRDASVRLDNQQKEKELAIEASKNEIRKEMQKSLIIADVERAKLQGKVEAYEKLMVKTDKIIELFEKSITNQPKLNIVME